MNAVDSIQNPAKPEDNLKTMDDIKKYIQDVPDDFIKDYNKIDYANDSLVVARAKAIKIRQLYDAHLKEAGVTPAESKAAAKTIDPNNPTKTDTTDKNAKATNDSVNKATGAVIAQATKPLEEAKKTVDAVIAQATGAAKNTDAKASTTTTTDSTTSTTDYNAKFDTMIQLLSSIASSLATITGTKAPAAATTTTQAGSQTNTNNAINASSAQAQTSALDMNAFTSIAAAMNKLANK